MKTSKRKFFALCRAGLQISLSQDTMDAAHFQGFKMRSEKFTVVKSINFKISHTVTMILETGPAQKALGLHLGVSGKTLQRAERGTIHHNFSKRCVGSMNPLFSVTLRRQTFTLGM